MVEETTDEDRPVAESFLEEASKEGRGKLKIFLGAAPGVGKTYAMLQAAHERMAEGVDVVAGVVETHGRAETEKLIAGIDILPRKKIQYRNKEFNDMDLEAVLERKPHLVLVDELAHTNVPGSIHEKRYQDVEILLQQQIDVYATLNIQHLESLNDIIHEITNVKVRETVPDHVLKSADEIELVDLPPKELIRRLSEGKVYVKNQARKAIRNFFSPRNLTALRELALRHTAEQVDDQMLKLMQQHAVKGPMPTRDRIMVCVDNDPLSENLVRTAARISARRRAPLIALSIDSAGGSSISGKHKEHLYKVLQLAENLGAETVTLSSRNVVDAILGFARDRNVTQIVIGQKYQSPIMRFLTGSITHDLIDSSGEIDMHIVNSAPGKKHDGIFNFKFNIDLNILKYVKSFAAVTVSLAIGWFLKENTSIKQELLYFAFLPGAIYTGVASGNLPALIAAISSVFLYDIFLLDPVFKITSSFTSLAVLLTMFVLATMTPAILATRLRTQVKYYAKKEQRIGALYNLSKEMAAALHLNDILAAIVTKLNGILDAETVILVPDEQKKSLKVAFPADLILTEKDYASASWCFEHSEVAGKGTETLTTADRIYIPLKTQRGSFGVLGVMVKDEKQYRDSEFRRLADALATQAALAIERAKLVEEIEEAIITKEKDSLRSVLLSSISYDLKTPLNASIAAISALEKFPQNLSKKSSEELLQIIKTETGNLNRFISSLLQITKIESGALIPQPDIVDLKELISYSLKGYKESIKQLVVNKNISSDLPFIKVDFKMMRHALISIIENAIKYSDSHDKIIIDINAEEKNGQVILEIRDRGIGVPKNELNKIFDKFYKLNIYDKNVTGVGLGLALSKSIVNAHGCKISAETPDDGDGGTVIIIEFPAHITKRLPEQSEAA